MTGFNVDDELVRKLAALLDDTNSHSIDTLAAITRDPEAICVQATPDIREATCGAVIADPVKRTLWALRGLPSEQRYEPFRLAD